MKICGQHRTGGVCYETEQCPACVEYGEVRSEMADLEEQIERLETKLNQEIIRSLNKENDDR